MGPTSVQSAAAAGAARARRRLRRQPATAAPLGLVAQRAADVLARDDRRVRSDAGARGAGARGARPARRRATRAAAAGPPPGAPRGRWRTASTCRAMRGRGWPPGAPAAGCDPTARGSRAISSAHGASRVPDHAEAEEGGHDRQAQAAVALDEVLDRGQHAVARAALARRRPAVGQPAVAQPRARRGRGRRPRSSAGDARPGSGQARSSRRGARAASRRRGRAAAAASAPGARSPMSRSSSLTVK